MTTTRNEPSQLDKVKKAARALAVDEDDARWEERMRKIVKQKRVEKPA